MNQRVEFKSRLQDLKPYNTHQEKDAVVLTMGDHDVMDLCRLLGAEPINELEAVAFIFKLREKSVNDTIDTTSACRVCNYMNIFYISIPKLFFNGNPDKSIPIGLFNDASEIPDVDYINNVSLEEYAEIDETVKENNKKIFNPYYSCNCKKCGNDMILHLNYKDIISKFSIKNIFEQYVDISYYTSMTKQDTDGMLPYEREIFLGLIQVKEDEKNKK